MVWELLDCGESVIVLKGFRLGSCAWCWSGRGPRWRLGAITHIFERHPIDLIIHFAGSKRMIENMFADIPAAHLLANTALRYFNMAGADSLGRTGQSTAGATRLIKAAPEAALGKRTYIEVFGTDYATRDGTCVRDYIHVTDLVGAHYLALRQLHAYGATMIANLRYGCGYSVQEVLEAVKDIVGKPFDIRYSGRHPGLPMLSWPMRRLRVANSAEKPNMTIFAALSRMRLNGNRN
jgi:UDP-glucose 4-epimerase